MVVVRLGGDRHVKKIMQERRDGARERKRKQRDTASEENKAKEKESDRLRKKRCIQGESRSLPETLQTTALPASPLLTRGYLLAYFRISFCVCVFLVLAVYKTLNQNDFQVSKTRKDSHNNTVFVSV